MHFHRSYKCSDRSFPDHDHFVKTVYKRVLDLGTHGQFSTPWAPAQWSLIATRLNKNSFIYLNVVKTKLALRIDTDDDIKDRVCLSLFGQKVINSKFLLISL